MKESFDETNHTKDAFQIPYLIIRSSDFIRKHINESIRLRFLDSAGTEELLFVGNFTSSEFLGCKSKLSLPAYNVTKKAGCTRKSLVSNP